MNAPQTDHQPLVSLKDCFYTLGQNTILTNLSFDLFPGKAVTLYGRNGSGKSTLLRICAGLLPAFTGKRLVQPHTTISYLGHAPLLYYDLSAYENLLFFAQLTNSPQQLTELLAEWELELVQDKPVRELSQGTKVKVGLCRALLGDPDVLLLDEPTAALDDHAVMTLQRALQRRLDRNAHAATIVATHDRARMQDWSDSTLYLVGGQIETGPETGESSR